MTSKRERPRISYAILYLVLIMSVLSAGCGGVESPTNINNQNIKLDIINYKLGGTVSMKTAATSETKPPTSPSSLETRFIAFSITLTSVAIFASPLIFLVFYTIRKVEKNLFNIPQGDSHVLRSVGVALSMGATAGIAVATDSEWTSAVNGQFMVLISAIAAGSVLVLAIVIFLLLVFITLFSVRLLLK